MPSLKHKFHSTLQDKFGTGKAQPSDWNAEHNLTTSTSDVILGRATAGAGDVELIPCTQAGRDLIGAATLADQQSLLGQAISLENKDSSTIYMGQPLSVYSGGAGVIKANSSNVSTQALSFATKDAAVNFTTDLAVSGSITLTDWSIIAGTSALSPNSPYYLGETPGTIILSPPSTPGTISQRVGRAISAQTLMVEIFPPFLN